MSLAVFPSGPFETNTYILSCPTTKETCVIDPSPESAEKIIVYIEKNQYLPKKILLTHSHWDHIADVAKLIRQYKIPCAIHQLDAPNLQNPGADGLPCWINVESVVPDAFFDEGDKIPLGTLTLQVIHTPGHSPGSVCFYLPEEKMLISGDTLFKSTIGNLSFPTSNANLMWPSLKKLAKLPVDTKVFPGHGPATSIGAEKWLANAEQIFG